MPTLAETIALNSLNWSDGPTSPPGPPPTKLRKKKSGNKIYNLPLLQAFPYQLKDKKADGEIGLEIECEGTHLFDAPIQYWNTHQDGSLRTVEGHPPIEYTLRKPLPREEVPKALTYLSRKLKEAGSSVVESTRTSVHVHLNCQELTIKQIYQIWCLYAVFEEMLIDFSGPNRKGNLFCLSGKQAEYNVYLLEQAIQQENFNELFNENLRYTSCNFASLSKFGSLEFRSMRGTVDQDLIQSWVDVLLAIKDKALTYGNPREIVKDFQETGPQGFVRNVFKNRGDLQQIFYSRDYHQMMWDGLRMMRDVAYAVKWQEYNPSLEKKDEPIVSELLQLGLPSSLSANDVDLDTAVIAPNDDIRWAVKVRHRTSGQTREVWLVQYDGMSPLNAWLENHTEESIVFRLGNYSINNQWNISGRSAYMISLDTFRFADRTRNINPDEPAPDEL